MSRSGKFTINLAFVAQLHFLNSGYRTLIFPRFAPEMVQKKILIFLLPYASTGNGTHISRVAAHRGTLIQDALLTEPPQPRYDLPTRVFLLDHDLGQCHLCVLVRRGRVPVVALPQRRRLHQRDGRLRLPLQRRISR